jgi:NAD(P)H-hydrate repair Nnr-like enzyme with NAD(P)H-hydrate dehydratase domain
MPCVHLRELYHLCAQHDLKLAGSDLIRIVCQQCGVQEVCPSVMLDEYEAQERGERTSVVDPKQSAARG